MMYRGMVYRGNVNPNLPKEGPPLYKNVITRKVWMIKI